MNAAFFVILVAALVALAIFVYVTDGDDSDPINRGSGDGVDPIAPHIS